MQVTEDGGCTKWTNLVAAYDALDDATKERIDGLGVRYRLRDGLDFDGYFKASDALSLADSTEISLVQVNPRTGRKGVWPNTGPDFAADVSGLAPEEGAELLAELYAHCTQEQFVYRHDWRVGDACLWINTQTMHEREAFPDDQERVLRHVSILGVADPLQRRADEHADKRGRLSATAVDRDLECPTNLWRPWTRLERTLVRYEGLVQAMPEDWERAVAVVAHPDDLEYGLASAVARWTGQGKDVAYVLATQWRGGYRRDGRPSAVGPLREDEERRSAAIVGVSHVEFLGHPDGAVEYGVALRRDLAAAFRRLRPDVVITMNFELTWGDGGSVNHADHRAVGLAALDACRDAANRWLFPELGDPWQGISAAYVAAMNPPTHFVDVGETLARGRRVARGTPRVHRRSRHRLRPRRVPDQHGRLRWHGRRLRVRGAAAAVPGLIRQSGSIGTESPWSRSEQHGSGHGGRCRIGRARRRARSRARRPRRGRTAARAGWRRRRPGCRPPRRRA